MCGRCIFYNKITMFKILIVVFTLYLASIVQSQNLFNSGLSPDLLLKLQKLSTAFQQKCLKNIDPVALSKIMSKIADTSVCVSKQYSTEITPKDYCTSYGNEFITCMQGFTDVAKGCLDSDEKYFPDFLINAQKRVLQTYCKDDFTARFNKLANSQCKSPLSQLLNTEFLSTCIPKLKFTQNLDKNLVSLKKADVCSDIKSLNDCFVNIIKTNCETTDDDVKVLSSVFEEYQKDCKSDSSGASIRNPVVIVTVLFAVIKMLFNV